MTVRITKRELLQEIRRALIARPHISEALLGENDSKNPIWPSTAVSEFNNRVAERQSERLSMMEDVLPSANLNPDKNKVDQIKVAIGVSHVLNSAFKSVIEAWSLGWLDHIEGLGLPSDPNQNNEFMAKGSQLVDNAFGAAGIMIGTMLGAAPYSSIIGEKAQTASQSMQTIKDTWSEMRALLEDISSLNVYREAQKIVRGSENIEDESIKDWRSTFDEVRDYESNLGKAIEIFSDENAQEISSIVGLSMEMGQAPDQEVEASPIFSNEALIRDMTRVLIKELSGEKSGS